MSLDWVLLVLRVLSVLVLYAFLSAVVYATWRDLRTAEVPNGNAASRSAVVPCFGKGAVAGTLGCLTCVTPGDTPLQISETLAVSAHATLGRAGDNQIVLTDACVSAHHARIDKHDGEWWLTDLDSQNGTLLNGLPISKPAPMASGDVIGVGQVQLKFAVVPCFRKGEATVAQAHPNQCS